jgi:hypothetical protein
MRARRNFDFRNMRCLRIELRFLRACRLSAFASYRSKKLLGVISVKRHRACRPRESPDLARVILVERITPDDVPAVDPRIKDAQSRTIHRGRRRTPGPDPNVLDRAAFEHPSKMAFSSPVLGAAAAEVMQCIQFPASDQPPIQVHVFRAVGCGTLRTERGEK